MATIVCNVAAKMKLELRMITRSDIVVALVSGSMALMAKVAAAAANTEPTQRLMRGPVSFGRTQKASQEMMVATKIVKKTLKKRPTCPGRLISTADTNLEYDEAFPVGTDVSP